MTHLLGFLGVATTGLVARAMAKGDVAEAKLALEQALRVAVTTGAVIGAIFIVAAVPMLAAFSGPACVELVEPAVVYTRIRALGFPFALAMSAQPLPARSAQCFVSCASSLRLQGVPCRRSQRRGPCTPAGELFA